MRTTKRRIIVSEEKVNRLIDRGYTLRSYDGEQCLEEIERTDENVNHFGDLTLRGAEIFALRLSKNPEIEDIKIVHAGYAFDVYAKVCPEKIGAMK